MEEKHEGPVRLTQYSHGSGCGCKIAPADLERILQDARTNSDDPRVLIGNNTSDDAAAIDIGDGRAVVTTTDFFMPIVDDAFDFGRISAANAISDVYAMGGSPLTAIAILGWPLEQLGAALAADVLNGARHVCKLAGISLSGGHSIESKEPFFGLSVTGLIDHSNIKTNQGAQPGDILFLTKPIGVGILATAIKRGLLNEASIQSAVSSMSALNSVGVELGKMKGVNALTDVTGFGLLGHLIEMCEGSNVSAELDLATIPLIEEQVLNDLLAKFVMPDNTMRNFKAFNEKVSNLDARQLQLLCDPQTSGGLLISVRAEAQAEVASLLESSGLNHLPIGKVIDREKPLVTIT
ncbi:MAG: selenide, water dikinase SelD [Cryomorphaceae bacterium]